MSPEEQAPRARILLGAVQQRDRLVFRTFASVPAVLYADAQRHPNKLWNLTESVGEGGPPVIHARNCESMFANDAVETLLTVRRQVDICELITGQTMVSGVGIMWTCVEPVCSSQQGLIQVLQ